MNKNNNQRAIDILCEQIVNTLKLFVKKNSTHIYNGTILAQSAGNKWTIKYNGETHDIEYYGTATPTINKRVKVFIPDGNQSLAFFI